jgi:hypothetical protein
VQETKADYKQDANDSDEEDEVDEDDGPNTVEVAASSEEPLEEPSIKLSEMLPSLEAIRSLGIATASRGVLSQIWAVVFRMLAVCAAVSWTGICVVARVHKHALTVLSLDHHMAFCFLFLYLFPFLVQYMAYWAPSWAAPCLWYAFLMQVFCTQGSPLLVSIFRVLLPLLFLTGGVSHHSFLMELNGAERIAVAYVLVSLKTQEYYRPSFLFCLSFTIVSSLLYGSNPMVQWFIGVVSIRVSHTDDKDRTRKRLPTNTPNFVPSNAAAMTSFASAPPSIMPTASLSDSSTNTSLTSAAGWTGSSTPGASSLSSAVPRRRPLGKQAVQKARRVGRRSVG